MRPMADRSRIEWTDATWNPVTGCTKVSAGCKHCYAERMFKRFGERSFTDVRMHEDRLDQPLLWRKPRRIFVCSMSDLFHKEVPVPFIARVLNTMASVGLSCRKRHEHDRDCWDGGQHTYLILTKRPDRMCEILSVPERLCEYLEGDAALPMMLEVEGWPLSNVWMGTSAEDQATLNDRTPHLLSTPAAVRFLSLEPLLGPIDVRRALASHCSRPGHREDIWELASRRHTRCPECGQPWDCPGVDWIIVGGESGGPPERALVEWGPCIGARDCAHGAEARTPGGRGWHPKAEAIEWVRSIRGQCQAAGVPFFFKQWGGPRPTSGGRLLDGRTWDEMPGQLDRRTGNWPLAGGTVRGNVGG